MTRPAANGRTAREPVRLWQCRARTDADRPGTFSPVGPRHAEFSEVAPDQCHLSRGTQGTEPCAQGVGRKKQEEPSGGLSFPGVPNVRGAGRIAVRVGDNAKERIPLVGDDKACQSGWEDSQSWMPDVARLERSPHWKASRSMEDMMGDTVKRYALPRGIHG
jgi:hypothetical protein